MKKSAIFVCAFCFFIVPENLQAQAVEEQPIRETLEDLFRAMELGDSSLARKCFASQVTTATVSRDKANATVIRHEDSVDGFMKAIGTPHKEAWYEEIWGLEIRIDGDFAQAWCDYAFYVGNNFSHCGVDAFHLVRENGAWKIFHLADTRRKPPYNIPQNIQDKHKS